MTRLNLILYFALMFSALGLVNAQHQARKSYIELEQLSQAEKQYNQEYGQLQLEQSTWAMHSRIEKIAAQQLQMQVPDAKRIQIVSLSKAPAQARSTAQSITKSEIQSLEQAEVAQ